MILSPQQHNKDESTLKLIAVKLQNTKVKNQVSKTTRMKSHTKLPQVAERTGWRSKSQMQGEVCQVAPRPWQWAEGRGDGDRGTLWTKFSICEGYSCPHS